MHIGSGIRVIACYVHATTHTPFYHLKPTPIWINVKHAKKLSVLLLALALTMVTFGWLEYEFYSWPQSRSFSLNSDTFHLASNETTYRVIPLNQTGSYSINVHIPTDTGTVFSAALTSINLQKWLSGNYNVSWDGTGNIGLSEGTTKSHYFSVPDNTTEIANIVLWNPETFTQQVDISVSRQWHEMDYANYTLSLALLASGVVIFLSLPIVWALKNRRKISAYQWTGKKIVTLAISVILLASGLWAANTFSGPVQAQETIAKGIVPVSANGQQCTTFTQSQSGDYYFNIEANMGTIIVYSNSENSTVDYWPNGTVCPKRPEFNGTSGMFCWGVFGDFDQPVTQYLVFLNPDGISKEVSYEITRQWTYSNYIGLTAGIAAAAAGALLFGLTLLQGKLKNFNKALENQL